MSEADAQMSSGDMTNEMDEDVLNEEDVLEVIDDGDIVDDMGHAMGQSILEGDPDAEEDELAGGADGDADDEEDVSMREVDMDVPDQSKFQFTKHSAPVFTVSVHAASNMVVSGGEDDCAYIWNVADGSGAAELLTKHEDSIVSTGFNKDGTMVATGSLDGVIRVLNVHDRTQVCELNCGDDLTWLQWHPMAQFLIAGTDGGSMYMWDVPGANMSFFSAHAESVSCGGWAPDGRNFLSASNDGSIVLWSPKTGKVISKLQAADFGGIQWGAVTCASWSPQGGTVAVGSSTGYVNVVLPKAAKVTAQIALGDTTIEAVALSHTMPQLLAVGTLAGTLLVFDVSTQRKLHVLQHEDGITRIVWLKHRPAVVCCSLDGTVRVWNCTTGACEKVLTGHTSQILDMAITGDEAFAVSCGEDNTCRVFELQ
eukprot:m.174003 g.174003  ORF g.174003 m.174003 type:complete len:425 (+) comp18314_c0_seq1:346-1620(+)